MAVIERKIQTTHYGTISRKINLSSKKEKAVKGTYTDFLVLTIEGHDIDIDAISIEGKDSTANTYIVLVNNAIMVEVSNEDLEEIMEDLSK